MRDTSSAPKLMTLYAVNLDTVSDNQQNENKYDTNNNDYQNMNEMIFKKNENSNYIPSKENYYYFNKNIQFPLKLATFQYNINDPQSIQSFQLDRKIINKLKLNGIKINAIQLKIHNNWGNSKYTCIYRVRIHGEEPELISSPLIPI